MRHPLRPLCSASILLLPLAAPAFGSVPPSHQVTVPTTPGTVVTVEWTGTSPPGTVGIATNSCTAGVLEDHHDVDLVVPAGAYDQVQVTAAFHIEWDDGGQDLVLTVLYDDSTEIASSDGGTPEENVVSTNPPAGKLTALTCAFLASVPTDYRGRLTLTASEPSQNPPAGKGNASGLPPRFHHYAPDYPRQGFGMFGGEATLDVNWSTGSIFYLGFLETMRLRLDDSTSPAGQTWDLRNGTLNSKATFDPILVGDPDTGRIFAQQLIFGEGQSFTEYSDDDGATWKPSSGGGQRSGADHQSLGVGPYPAGLRPLTSTYPNAVYYCSQDVALVFCSRSDDGGVTFNPGVPVYTLAECQGLHGHVKIAPDGTVYLPVAGCPSGLVSSTTSQPAVVVSHDAGLTWSVRKIGSAAPGSGGHGSDPSVAIAKDGTVYYSYVARNGHIHMVRSRDRGLTWERDVDLGALSGITAAQFPAVVAGDADRAAVAFFGTTYTGDGVDTAENFEGTWQLFVAATYDGGLSYHVVDTTPGDPIQKGGICSGGFCRNLLDFFDAVIDPQGRIVVAYEDGCVGGCPLGMPGTFSDQAVIARQSGGRRLLAAFDPVEPGKPGAPRIGGYRTESFALVEWPAPDHAGDAIRQYRVYRGTSPSSLKKVATIKNGKQAYVDTKLDAGATYYYRVTAVNGRGESPLGNTLALAVGSNAPTPQAACTMPGLLAAIDRVGEPEAAPLTRDIEAIYIAEPPPWDTTFGADQLVFTLKLAESAPLQGGARFKIFFYVPATGRHVRLNISPATSGNTYGHLDQDPVTGWHNTVFTDGQLDKVVYTLDGSIQVAIAKSKLGVGPGDQLLAVYADSQPAEAGSNVTREEAGYFDYRLVAAGTCP